VYKLNYSPRTLGVQSWREITSGGTGTKNAKNTTALDNRLIYGSEAVSLTQRPLRSPVLISQSALRSTVWLETLGQLQNVYHISTTRSSVSMRPLARRRFGSYQTCYLLSNVRREGGQFNQVRMSNRAGSRPSVAEAVGVALYPVISEGAPVLLCWLYS
jgi:hypothetical protein